MTDPGSGDGAVREGQRRLRRLDPRTLRAAWWALRASRRARRLIREQAPDTAVELPAVPSLPAAAERGVAAVLRRLDDTCLVQATVLQAWHAAHGRRRDLIIGVTAPGEGFQAHAWLEGDAPCHGDEFRELLRRPA